jgi:hypothetical protein
MQLRVNLLLASILAIIEITSIILMCFYRVPIVAVVVFAILFTLAIVLLIRVGKKEQRYQNLTGLRIVAYICCLATMIGSIVKYCLSPEEGVLFPALLISSALLTLLGLSLSKNDCIN